MGIYQTFGIIDETMLLSYFTKSFPSNITSAQILPNAYEGEDVLGLQMRDGKISYGYGLVGEVKEKFMRDCKVENIEDLVGKSLLVFTNKGVIKGLSAIFK